MSKKRLRCLPGAPSLITFYIGLGDRLLLTQRSHGDSFPRGPTNDVHLLLLPTPVDLEPRTTRPVPEDMRTNARDKCVRSPHLSRI